MAVMKTALIASLAIAPCFVNAQAQPFAMNLNYATDGHSYALARVAAFEDLIDPKSKSVFWSLGGAAGQDVTENLGCAGGYVGLKVKGGHGTFASLDLSFLTKEKQKGVTGHLSVSFGWSF